MLLTLFGAYSLACSYVYVAPSLPSVEAMRKVEMQVPLRVFTTSGELIAQIGEQRRLPVTYEQIPPLVREAFLAAEDDQFFRHGGVDYLGILRAAVVNLVSNEKAQGASTITQQAARNMFLTLDKTWKRKLSELFVTWRMEREFSKQEILGLYLNVIYFGQRAYGSPQPQKRSSASRSTDLTVSEAATLAGVPQAPSKYNPITNPEFAGARRGYVLGRMHKLGYIDDAAYEEARKTPVVARAHAPLSAVEAPYVAEMARLDLRSRFRSGGGSRWISGLHDDRRSPAGRCESRAAHRAHRIRPPARLARANRPRGHRRPQKDEAVRRGARGIHEQRLPRSRRRRVGDGEDRARVRALPRLRADRVGRAFLGPQGRRRPGARRPLRRSWRPATSCTS